ncbi:MAG: zinc ribbon domain-containing protein, partial [Chloroflexales bacterium]
PSLAGPASNSAQPQRSKVAGCRIGYTKGQQRILEQQLEESRSVYNELLAERKRAYEERGESLRKYDTLNLLPLWKLTRPSMKLVHSQVLQNIGIRVDLAFHAFFRRVKEGATEVGFSRFKGFGRYDSLTYPQYGNGVRVVKTLRDRTHSCPYCGLVMDRDENAAINILQRGLQTLRQ